MAPVVIVKFFRYRDPIVEQLHFYQTLDAPEIFDQFIAPSEKAAQLFTLFIRYRDALQPAVFEFPADELGVYFIGFGEPLLALAVDISGVDHQ